MNITFDGADKAVHTHSNVDRDTTVYRGSEGTGKISQNHFALDISGTVMDNSAYAGHGRTAEEVMQEAGQQDITARRNYMAVMSNSMSDEDFAKLWEEGFHPGSTDMETVVTIVGHIKAAMLKGGNQVAGYTDTMDAGKLTEITGSEVFAGELEKVFAQKDVPLTEENAEAVVKAYNAVKNIAALPEGSVKYMIENNLPPTVENLYTARYAATDDGSHQGKGYYAAGGVSGYMAKKPESIDYQQLMPQIEKTIERAGCPVNEETIRDAKWLIEKGIPFHEGTLRQKLAMSSLSFPVSREYFVQSAAAALADGSLPMKADLTKTRSCLEQSLVLAEQTAQIDEKAVELVQTQNLPFTLRNLIAASDALKSGSYGAAVRGQNENGNVKDGVLLLNEVRLSMSVEANMHLLKKGYQIDTAPMEELLTHLQREQQAYHQTLIQETDEKAAEAKGSLYRETLFTVESIRFAPIVVAADITKESTLRETDSYGRARAAQYQRAGERYETLMTAPRKDMGDSILRAFRNTDDILSDLNKDASEENRRVVRILGYNSMEINEENFEAVKQADTLLRQVTDSLKPAAVLSMIRNDMNPLTMSLEELNDYLGKQQPEHSQEIESYSRFLYQLEQKNGISEEERSAYIGIYRLLRQIEKGDNAAVGAVLRMGGEQKLSNLLTAVRSSRRAHMDYHVDDSFGGVQARENTAASITEQIEKGYITNRKQLEEALADEESVKAAEAYNKSIYEGVRSAMGSEEAVLQYLTDYGQLHSADNLLRAGEQLRGLNEIFRRLRKICEERNETDAVKEADFPQKLTSKEETLNTLEKMTDNLLEMVEKESFEGDYTSLDLKTMSLTCKQLVFMRSMAREENYEIPVEIGGSLTSINLKMIHKQSGESKVFITFETKDLGKNAAEFIMEEQVLSGYGICDNAKGSELLNQKRDLFAAMLKQEDIVSGDIRFMQGESLDLAEFSLKASKDRTVAAAPDLLYKAAKAYIGYIQEISK